MPTQPTSATPTVNTGHALATSLAFCAVFNHASALSGQAKDVVSGRTGTLGADASWTTGLYGNAVASPPDSHTAAVDFGNFRPLGTLATWSGFFLARCDSIGNYRALITARDNYATQDFGVEVAPDGTVMVGCAATLTACPTAVLTGSAWARVGVAVNGTDAKVYLGGLLAGSAAGDFRATNSDPATNSVRVGGIRADDAAESFGGAVECAYLWTGRVLTGADFTALSADPYVFLSDAAPPAAAAYFRRRRGR